MASSYRSTYQANLDLLAFINSGNTAYVSLFTVRPAADGTGGTEVSGNAYARKSVVLNSTNFPVDAGATSCSNGTVISFLTPTGTGWGTVNSFAIMDNSSGGHFLYIGDLTTSLAVPAGSTMQFIIGALVVGEA